MWIVKNSFQGIAIYLSLSMSGRTRNQPDEEPMLPPGANEGPTSVKSIKKNQFSGIKDSISDKDLENHSVAKIVAKTLLGEVKKCESEIGELETFRDRFHESNLNAAVLSEKLGGMESATTVRSLLYSLGGIFGGLLFNSGLTVTQQIGFAVLCVVCFLVATLNPLFIRRK